MAVCFKDVVSITTSTAAFGVDLAEGTIVYNMDTKEAIILGAPVTAATIWNDIPDKNYITRKTVKVSLLNTDVAVLGTTPFALLPKPGPNKAYDIIDIKWRLNPTSTLDVGGQNLTLYFDGITNYMASIRNSLVEKATELLMGIQVQAEHEFVADARLMCKLNGGIDPLLGVAVMDFWITYSIIDV